MLDADAKGLRDGLPNFVESRRQSLRGFKRALIGRVAPQERKRHTERSRVVAETAFEHVRETHAFVDALHRIQTERHESPERERETLTVSERFEPRHKVLVRFADADARCEGFFQKFIRVGTRRIGHDDFRCCAHRGLFTSREREGKGGESETKRRGLVCIACTFHVSLEGVCELTISPRALEDSLQLSESIRARDVDGKSRTQKRDRSRIFAEIAIGVLRAFKQPRHAKLVTVIRRRREALKRIDQIVMGAHERRQTLRLFQRHFGRV